MEFPGREQELKESSSPRGSLEFVLGRAAVSGPGLFRDISEFLVGSWRERSLEPKIKELIYIAIDAATTHLYVPGLRTHIRNALGYGAAKEEIMEVLELVSVLGIRSCALGVPMILEELESREREAM
jgi:alkylhydroperoxidase/carboxymuconolactone decarboxylase family protein YurZ